MTQSKISMPIISQSKELVLSNRVEFDNFWSNKQYHVSIPHKSLSVGDPVRDDICRSCPVSGPSPEKTYAGNGTQSRCRCCRRDRSDLSLNWANSLSRQGVCRFYLSGYCPNCLSQTQSSTRDIAGIPHPRLGFFGLMLGAALLGGVVWLLVDIELLNVQSFKSATWIVLVCVSLLLAVGLSWSHVWRRLTGQFEVDDGDN